MTLKLRILRSLTRLFIILLSLTMSLFSEKMLIFNRCVSGLMSNLIKKSWTVSNTNTSHSRIFASALVSKRNPRKSLFVLWSLLWFGFCMTVLNTQFTKVKESYSPKYILLLKSYWVKQFSFELLTRQSIKRSNLKEKKEWNNI